MSVVPDPMSRPMLTQLAQTAARSARAAARQQRPGSKVYTRNGLSKPRAAYSASSRDPSGSRHFGLIADNRLSGREAGCKEAPNYEADRCHQHATHHRVLARGVKRIDA